MAIDFSSVKGRLGKRLGVVVEHVIRLGGMESCLRRERQPRKRKVFSLRLCCQILCIVTLPLLVLGFGFAPISGPVEAHGGGLDSDGGHTVMSGHAQAPTIVINPEGPGVEEAGHRDPVLRVGACHPVC
jgi:hypothetical protein